MLTNFAIRVFKLISLICQLVHVVEQGVVLLLRFDKRSDNLVNGGDARGLLDLLKGILNDLHVPQVLVHQALLFPIGGHDLGQTQLKDSQRVLELAVFVLLVLRWRSRLVVVYLVLFLFLVEFLLVALDLSLEVILIFFVLGPECNGLVDLLLSQTLAKEGRTVLLFCLFVHLFGEVGQSGHLAVLVHDLAAQHVNLALVLLVLRLRLVEVQLLVLDRVLLSRQPDVVQLVIDGLRTNLLDVVPLLSQLVVDLLDLVLQDLQLSLFILELLSVDVDFALQSGRLTLVDGVVAAAHRTSCN